jgi:predicted DNA-binding protein (MmcQ/YjbR family)
MAPDELRSWCLGMSGAIETFPFNPETSVFKVDANGKMFALSALAATPLKVSVKCEPELGESLRDSHEAVSPGYHLNKRHWITVEIGGDVDDESVRELVEDSYDLVKPARRPAARQTAGP